jgi:hypothetical protein
MDTAAAAKYLRDTFGMDISDDMAAEAYKELMTYQDLKFETLRGKYKLSEKGNCYILLAVENTKPHNGAWVRYIDDLKASYQTIVVQSVVNDRLMGWLLRNGFSRTKKHKDWAIWRK